jgi:AraC-like DNA-binding protein/quercetin dioxygenase-like cupin family protein
VNPGALTATTAVFVSTFPMSPGRRFKPHVHDRHQLAWASTGVLSVTTDSGTWVLPPTRALWIPATVRHEVLASGRTTMRALYVGPQRSSKGWIRPTPIAVGPLLAPLIDYLAQPELKASRRRRAEAVLFDLLEPVAVATIEAPMPRDDRAREVAAALCANPADPRGLNEWGRTVGASGRTLARAFLADTGIPFGRWRTRARLQAALPALAAGEPVSNVARRIGYDTPSAFVAAFRRETGLTPGGYFRTLAV